MTNSTKRPKLIILSDPQSELSNQQEEEEEEEDGEQEEEEEEEAEEEEGLLVGLPDHIAQLCLFLVPPSTLYSVCRSWRRLIYSPSFPPFLSLYTLSSSSSSSSHQSIHFLSFDPISATWQPLPPLPPLRLQLHHPSFLSWTSPVQSVAASGKLVLLAATTPAFLPAIPRPLVFDPGAPLKWVFGPPLAAPRRWCAAGAIGGAVFVASGIGSTYSPEVARSVEKWEIEGNPIHSKKMGAWERMGGFRDGKFSREAIEAVGWRGKLCMVNVKGKGVKEGVVYDVVRDAPEEMPEGMLSGWRGPAASMEEETLYMVEQSSGSLRRYEEDGDRWVDVMASQRLRGAEQMAAAGGRVCAVCRGGGPVAVVDVVAAPPRMWLVDLPLGFESLAVHILPRMSHRHHHHHPLQ